MSKLLTHLVRQAYSIIIIPVLVSVVLAGFWWLFAGLNAAYSALLGTGVWFVPQLYLVSKLFGKALQKPPLALITVFYSSELIKFLLSAVLFVMVIKYLPVSAVTVLIAFISAQITFLLTVLVYLGLKVS